MRGVDETSTRIPQDTELAEIDLEREGGADLMAQGIDLPDEEGHLDLDLEREAPMIGEDGQDLEIKGAKEGTQGHEKEDSIEGDLDLIKGTNIGEDDLNHLKFGESESKLSLKLVKFTRVESHQLKNSGFS